MKHSLSRISYNKCRASHLREGPVLAVMGSLSAVWEDAQIITSLTLPSHPPPSRTPLMGFGLRVRVLGDDGLALSFLKYMFRLESHVARSFPFIQRSPQLTSLPAVSGATGSVSGVKYENITLSSISTYGIVIEQDYENGSPTGIPTTGVPITDLTISNIKGTVDSDATNIYILCGSGSCSDWTWSGVSVTGGIESTACENIPSGASC
jgi:hypothetical protein